MGSGISALKLEVDGIVSNVSRDPRAEAKAVEIT